MLELIAQAQGLTEFASRDHIVVIRQSGATTTRVPFNYRKVADGSEPDNFFVRAAQSLVKVPANPSPRSAPLPLDLGRRS